MLLSIFLNELLEFFHILFHPSKRRLRSDLPTAPFSKVLAEFLQSAVFIIGPFQRHGFIFKLHKKNKFWTVEVIIRPFSIDMYLFSFVFSKFLKAKKEIGYCQCKTLKVNKVLRFFTFDMLFPFLLLFLATITETILLSVWL